MPRGGPRKGPNIGRPKGSLNKRTAAIAQIAANAGVTPIEAMLEAMRYHYDKAKTAPEHTLYAKVAGEKVVKDHSKATHFQFVCEYAAKAAPYIHPRLANIEHTGGDGGPIEHNHTIDREARLAALMARVDKRVPRKR